jgi:seryl-tRNA synthetase
MTSDNLENKYNELEKQRESAEQQHAEILVKIVSVTNDVVKQQLQEEYKMIIEKLNNITNEYKLLRKEYLSNMRTIMLGDLEFFYSCQFKKSSLLDVMKAQNIDLIELEKKYKLRPIRFLRQKRELCLLLNILNKYIKIVDYQGVYIDQIGKTADSCITIRLNTFACVNNDVDDPNLSIIL